MKNFVSLALSSLVNCISHSMNTIQEHAFTQVPKVKKLVHSLHKALFLVPASFNFGEIQFSNLNLIVPSKFPGGVSKSITMENSDLAKLRSKTTRWNARVEAIGIIPKYRSFLISFFEGIRNDCLMKSQVPSKTISIESVNC